MLFDSLFRLTIEKPYLVHEEKVWLIETINNKLDTNGKETLYSLLLVHNKQQTDVYDPKEPFLDIEQVHPRLQTVWFEFAKMHLKKQKVESRLLEGRSGSPGVVGSRGA